MHSTTEFSAFEIVYGFNPLTPMDLIHLPINERVSLDGNHKAQVVKTLHESVRQQIEKRNHVYATKANKGRKHVVFQLGDWVWVHMRKERFPAHMMRISPTPSVIMPTTHWRCQLGQSQELGQRSLKKH